MDVSRAWGDFKKVLANPSMAASEFFRIVFLAAVLAAAYFIFIPSYSGPSLNSVQTIAICIILLFVIPINAFFNESIIGLVNSDKTGIKDIFSRKKFFKRLCFYSIFRAIYLVIVFVLIVGLVEYFKTQTVSSAQSFINAILLFLLFALFTLAVMILGLFFIFSPFYILKGRKFWESMKESFNLVSRNKMNSFLFLISFVFAEAMAFFVLIIPALIAAAIIVQIEVSGVTVADNLKFVLMGIYAAICLPELIAYFKVSINRFFNEISKTAQS